MNERTQGAAVLTVAAAGVGLAVFVYSRDAFVLLVWAVGAAAVWWVARTPNPSPTSEKPRPEEKTPGQFTVREDRPGHHVVEWGESQRNLEE